MPATSVESEELSKAVNRLVDEQRQRCLWYLRSDYYPATTAERVRVLDAVARHGDLETYRRADELKRWLSRLTSETSAAS